MWKKTTEERYNAELDHMIPTAMTNCGFLVSEPDDHNAERQPRYAAFIKINGEFFESAAPITINEFDSLEDGRPWQRSCRNRAAGALGRSVRAG